MDARARLRSLRSCALALVLCCALGDGVAAPSHSAASPVATVGASGRTLTLDGVPHDFVGVDAYELATQWGVNAGCGTQVSGAGLLAFFRSLPHDSLVRIWAFQGSMATDLRTGRIDWGPLARVFAAATATGQHLIVAVADQGGTCDTGAWQEPSWYAGGFLRPQGEAVIAGVRVAPLSYWRYLGLLVKEFRSSPALAMWEPMSEAEASTCPPRSGVSGCAGAQTCPDERLAARALRHFYDVVGAEIHRLDPEHLVESGLLGGGQCGTSGPDYAYVTASPGIDVASLHAYCSPMTPLCGDAYNGEGVRLAQVARLGKPLLIGEEGMPASARGGACATTRQRAHVLGAKATTELAAGAAGVLFWDWVPRRPSGCTDNFSANDPTLRLVARLADRAPSLIARLPR